MGMLIGNWKYEYAYDENGHQTSYASYYWDYELNQWKGDWKDERTYDANGYQTGSTSYEWKFGEWMFSRKYKYDLTFDAAGRLILEIDYRMDEGKWVESSKYEFSYDELGNQTSYIYYYWYGYDWQKSSKNEYTYDTRGNRTSNIYYYWDNDNWDWIESSKNENAYDERGNQTLYAFYIWRLGEWATQSMALYSYDSYGRQTSSQRYNEVQTSNAPYVLSLNLSDDPITYYLDERGIRFDGNNFDLKSLYVDQYVNGHDGIGYVPVWSNNGSLGEINWSPFYRFTNENYRTGEECYAFPMETWDRIKSETVRVNITCDDPSSAIIYITSGWWDPLYGGQTYKGTEIIQTDADGQKYLLINLKEEGNLINYIDERQFLFTGQGYTVESICLMGIVPETADDTEKKIFWENDGTHDYITWTGEYLFGAASRDYNGECLATFSDEDWELLKSQPLRVEIETLSDWISLRVTTGWWSRNFMGIENLYEYNFVQQDPDGTYYFEINLQDDPDLLDLVDEQHLLFTGDGYKILRITSGGGSSAVSNDDLLEITEDGYWKRHNFWKSKGNYYSNYVFTREGISTGYEIATISTEDWAIIKNGDFKVAFTTSWPEHFSLRVTTSHQSPVWKDLTMDIFSEYITGGPEYELQGSSREDSSFDEFGNQASRTSFEWINGEWAESYSYIYYYSAHTDIREVLQELRPRVSKQLRNGQVIIMIGDKAYNIAGEELK